jgi:hypothetical protein
MRASVELVRMCESVELGLMRQVGSIAGGTLPSARPPSRRLPAALLLDCVRAEGVGLPSMRPTGVIERGSIQV